MHSRAYTTLAATESFGWYYQARARCLVRLIERFVSPDAANLKILDVGCGTGGTSDALCRFGHVTGLEPSTLAIELLRDRYPDIHVVQGAAGDITSLLEPATFDLATIMGVLYHRNVADPASALRQVHHVLRPGGWIVWNEAVYPILWRNHDDFVEAGRRFYPGEMRAMLEKEGFAVRSAAHLLAWGFPIGLTLAMFHRAKRLLSRSRRYEDHVSDDRPLPSILNATLRELTYFEWACSLRHIKAPFGVSYLVIAQKTAP